LIFVFFQVHFAVNNVKSKALAKPVLKKAPEPSKTALLEPEVEEIEEEPKGTRITCVKDLDDALKLYQSLCPKDVSPDTSLITPRSINKAYFDIFKNGNLDSSDSSVTIPQNLNSSGHKEEARRDSLSGLEILRESLWSKTAQPEANVDEVVRCELPAKTTLPTKVAEATT